MHYESGRAKTDNPQAHFASEVSAVPTIRKTLAWLNAMYGLFRSLNSFRRKRFEHATSYGLSRLNTSVEV